VLLTDYLPIVTNALLLQYGAFALPYAEKILQHLLNCSRSELYLDRTRYINEGMQSICSAIIARCTAGEPLEYITGVAYFYDREFIVTPDVLIPRPDTETLIETVLGNEPVGKAFFTDLGTGSGCIACVLTEQRPLWVGIAVDCSLLALKVAVKNRRTERVIPVCGDMTSMLAKQSKFDFIVTNPPYIPMAHIKSLDCSVKNFEPHGALDGGYDGLDYYRYLAENASYCLIQGGHLYGEIGADQGACVENVFARSPWNNFKIHKDLSGHDRVFQVQIHL